jgi:sortase (surface protein transpeptidase)
VGQDDEVRRSGPLRALTRGLGELLVTGGVVVLLFVAYELFVTDLLNDRRQAELNEQVRAEWRERPAGPAAAEAAVGDPLAVLYIPRLGADYRRVVLEGTAEEQLSQGPGHYPGTARPGEQGNVAIAGHRVGKGSPFLDLDRLVPGDPVVLETADEWLTYRVLGDPVRGDFDADPSGIPGRQVILPTQMDVVSPTPDAAADAPASGAYLTLTTCHPRYSARQRLVIHAVLDGAPVSKTEQPDGPPALRGR